MNEEKMLHFSSVTIFFGNMHTQNKIHQGISEQFMSTYKHTYTHKHNKRTHITLPHTKLQSALFLKK